MVLKNQKLLKIYGIIGALITLLVPFFLMILNPKNHLENAQSFCPLKMLSGFPCPGCGITKSMVFFYEGNFQKSLSNHLFGSFLIVFCVATIIVLSTELITQKTYFRTWLFNKKLGFILGIFLATYHFVRLISFVKNNSMASILHETIWR